MITLGYFVIRYPKNVNKRPRVQLKNIYKKASVAFPVFKNSNISRLKVENVVRPPKNPTVMNNFRVSEMFWNLFKVSPKTSPKRKHPTIFTRKVPKTEAGTAPKTGVKNAGKYFLDAKVTK